MQKQWTTTNLGILRDYFNGESPKSISKRLKLKYHSIQSIISRRRISAFALIYGVPHALEVLNACITLNKLTEKELMIKFNIKQQSVIQVMKKNPDKAREDILMVALFEHKAVD